MYSFSGLEPGPRKLVVLAKDCAIESRLLQVRAGVDRAVVRLRRAAAQPSPWLAGPREPEGTEGAVQDRVTAAFPNVTLLQIREILEKIVTIIRAIPDGVRFVGTFTVLAGVAILAGAVSAGAARRRREVALLKTLGTTRGGVVAIYSVEYALIGVVAGAIGSVGGAVLSWAVLVHGMEVDWHFDPLPLLVGLAGGAALAVLAGLAASFRALQSRPIEVLRRAM
jgi:putative ABC transport system permease protein